MNLLKIHNFKKLDCHEDGANIRFNVNLLFKEPEKIVQQKGITVEQMYFTQVEDGWTTDRCQGKFNCLLLI